MTRLAADSTDERRVPLLGRLYASLLFSEDVSPAHARFLARLAEQLTYHELICLAAVTPTERDKPFLNAFRRDYHRAMEHAPKLAPNVEYSMGLGEGVAAILGVPGALSNACGSSPRSGAHRTSPPRLRRARSRRTSPSMWPKSPHVTRTRPGNLLRMP